MAALLWALYMQYGLWIGSRVNLSSQQLQMKKIVISHVKSNVEMERTTTYDPRTNKIVCDSTLAT